MTSNWLWTREIGIISPRNEGEIKKLLLLPQQISNIKKTTWWLNTAYETSGENALKIKEMINFDSETWVKFKTTMLQFELISNIQGLSQMLQFVVKFFQFSN